MTNSAVQIESLEVVRVPGIEHGQGFSLDDLSPGVNIIHGPNGSGKSTTLSVIQALLWPHQHALERPMISGRLKHQTQKWTIKLDHGHVEAHSNEQPGALPEFGPPEHRSRYHLALHELVHRDKSNFAKHIADLSQGGYDLASAAEALEYRERPASPNKLTAALKNAKNDVRRATDRHREIQNDVAKLDTLHTKRQQAIAAGKNVSLLQKARDYRVAAEQVEALHIKLSALPAQVAKLKGDERKTLDDLDERIEKLNNELANAEKTCRDNERIITDLNLPNTPIDDTTLSTMRADQRRLLAVESDLRQAQQQCAEAQVKMQQSQDRLGEHLADRQATNLNAIDLPAISQFARRSEQLRARRQALEAKRKLLSGDEPQAIQNISRDQLSEGLTHLRTWLDTPTADHTARQSALWPQMALALLAAGLAVALALLHHWAWSLAVVPVVVMVILIALRSQGTRVTNQTTDLRPAFQQKFSELNLPQPTDWSAASISEHVRALIELSQARAQFDDAQRQLQLLATDDSELARHEAELETERARIADSLGIQLNVADEWLPALAENLQHWHEQSDRLASAQTSIDGIEAEQKALVTRLRNALQPFGYSAADQAEVFDQQIEDLRSRQDQHKQLSQHLSDTQSRIESKLQPELAALRDKRRKVYHDLGLNESQDAELDAWLADHPRFTELSKQRVGAEAVRDGHEQSLLDHPQLLELSDAELRVQLQAEQQHADSLADTIEHITGIEKEIEDAKSDHTLAEALEVQDAARAELESARDKACASAVGALLTRWVRTEAVEKTRPQVFRRANELFVQFTRGTLQLELDDHASPPTFSARRGDKPARSITQLSVGERMQLLMAVRIAFLESDEPAKLPLLMDEALGASDDGRAGVIIDTVIDIAEQGRQVFYFTAQTDEVGKWIEKLKAANTPFKEINLAQVRHLSTAANQPLVIAPVDVLQPPAPAGMDHAAYGQTLKVPNLDPAQESIVDVHLWHVLDDVDLLHRLLCQQIHTWGQLALLAQQGGVGLLAANNGQFDMFQTRARAIENACRLWRIGRGKSVDRGVLIDSGAVSERFMDEVAALAESCNGDAAQILDALTEGQVKGFRAGNIEKLRDDLESKGYLDENDMLSPSDLNASVRGQAGDDLTRGVLTHEWIDRLLAKLPT